MTQRMAGKGVERKKRDIDRQDQRANADSEMAVEEKGVNGVVPKKKDEQHREIKEVAMDVLQNEWEGSLAAIIAACRFTDGASWRVEEEGAIKRFAIVIASRAKTERAGENQQGR